MKIAGRRRVSGGWMVRVESGPRHVDRAGNPVDETPGVPDALEVFVPDALVSSAAPEQVRQAVIDALSDDPFAAILGTDPSNPPQTKAVFEARAEELYADWKRWKDTRVEAAARSMAAAVVTALQAREDAAWTKYVTLLNQWRNAP